MMKRMKISVLVVLYNKIISDSATLRTMLLCNDLCNVDLTVVNNGPKSIPQVQEFLSSNESLFLGIRYIEHLENKPLSKVYNDFIDCNSRADYYVIIDDDSKLESTFFRKIVLNTFDICVPRILSVDDGQYYYPTVKGVPITSEGYIDIDDLISISSGLTIKRDVVTLLKNKYGSVFDENFALYGVDTSFFLRLKELDCRLNVICSSTIMHSLSRANNSKPSLFRERERLYDAAIIARRYPNRIRIYYFVKRLLKNIILFNRENLFSLITCFIKGKHPRC